MNRAERRAHAKQTRSRFSSALVEIPESEWPKVPGVEKPNRVWVSKAFMVSEYPEKYALCRLSVNRTTLNASGRWDDDISWDELQGIKSQVGYGHCMAVEVFPPDSCVVNVANMRHLFIVEASSVSFAWGPRCAG